jgi:hypothetical protein
MPEPLLVGAPPGAANLTSKTQGKTENPSDLRVGTVSSVTSQGIGVDLATGTVFASHLDSYSPTIGDSVAMMKTQDSWVVMGRMIGSGTRAKTDLTGPGPAFTGSTLAGFILNGSGATLATSTGSPGATVDLSKFVLDYYHPPGHHVRCKVGFFWTGSTAATTLVMDFWENTTPTVFNQLVIVTGSVASSSNRWTDAEFILDAARFGGAPRNINLALTTFGGGTINVIDSSNRGYLILEDLGDTSFIPAI